MRPTILLCCLCLFGCYAAPPVEDFTLRLEASARYAFIDNGEVRIDGEDLNGNLITGDELSFTSDLKLEPSLVAGAQIDLRPTNNAELRLSYLRFDSYQGKAAFDRDITIAGEVFEANADLDSEVAIDRLTLSYAHRLVAVGYEQPVSFDGLLRVGLEYNHIDVQFDGVAADLTQFLLDDNDGKVAEDLHLGSPFVGIDLRLGLGERTLLWSELRVGYLSAADFTYQTLDCATGVRVRLFGPLDLGVFYEYSLRDGEYDPSDDEIGGEFNLSSHAVGVAVGLQF